MEEKKQIEITDVEIDGMVELAKTNEAMRNILEQAKIIYELAKPTEVIDDYSDRWAELRKSLAKMKIIAKNDKQIRRKLKLGKYHPIDKNDTDGIKE